MGFPANLDGLDKIKWFLKHYFLLILFGTQIETQPPPLESFMESASKIPCIENMLVPVIGEMGKQNVIS